MEYGGKGGRNDYGAEFSEDFKKLSKKQYNKPFYLVCIPCNHHGEKNEILCTKCNERMYTKSGMIRRDKNGNFKF